MEEVTDTAQPIINITGQLVGLGPLRRDLMEVYQRWISNFDTLRTLATIPPMPMTLEQEVDWYDGVTGSSTTAAFTIYELATMQPVGNTALSQIDYRNRSATFGIMIGEPDVRNRGYGTEATRLILDYAFIRLGLHNVMLLVAEYNHGGIRAYEKAGYREFGQRTAVRFLDGRWWDDVYMQALATDFTSASLKDVTSSEELR